MGPYEIKRIERPNLVFIPKFGVRSKLLDSDEGAGADDLESKRLHTLVPMRLREYRDQTSFLFQK
jgi:hypothetical protein